MAGQRGEDSAGLLHDGACLAAVVSTGLNSGHLCTPECPRSMYDQSERRRHLRIF